MKKFELFLGCLGNGTTVFNKAVEENGDYKKIAHITNGGFIKWYVNPGQYVPGDDLLKIEHYANVQTEKWNQWFDKMPEIRQYGYLLDMAPISVFLDITKSDFSTCERIQILKNKLFSLGLI